MLNGSIYRHVFHNSVYRHARHCAYQSRGVHVSLVRTSAEHVNLQVHRYRFLSALEALRILRPDIFFFFPRFFWAAGMGCCVQRLNTLVMNPCKPGAE